MIDEKMNLLNVIEIAAMMKSLYNLFVIIGIVG